MSLDKTHYMYYILFDPMYDVKYDVNYLKAVAHY